jgi:hypothetical protein
MVCFIYYQIITIDYQKYHLSHSIITRLTIINHY